MLGKQSLTAASCLTILALLMSAAGGCTLGAAPTPTAKPVAPTSTLAPAASPTQAPSAPTSTRTPAPAPTQAPPAVATPKPAPPAPTPKPATDQPRSGGILAVTHQADPGHLDLQRMRGPIHALIAPGYSGILQWDSSNPEKLAPDLAERWETSPDGKTYTFQMRKEAKWHDGKEFTAADAKFSIERLGEKASPHAVMLLAVEKAEAPDASTLKLFLKYPSASLPVQLANAYMSIFPRHTIEAKGDMKTAMVGTGAFKLKAYNSNVSLEYARNENYFVKGLPYLDGVIFYLIRDRTTQLAAFRVGNVKMTSLALALTKSDADLMRRQAPNAVIHPVNRLKGMDFFMNANLPPWNDVRVRRAVFLAWDREAAIKVVGQGAGEIRASMLTGAYALSKEEVLKLPGFRQPKDADRAEAKRLLAEAGQESFTTKIMTPADYPDYVRLAEFGADQLKTIGITGSVDGQDVVVYTQRRFRADFHSMAEGVVLDNADPDGAARYFASPNEQGFVDPEIDRLFAQQSQTMDPAERKKLVRQMELRLIDQAWYVTSHWDENYLFAWPEVKNAGPRVAGPTNNSRYIRDVWLAK